MSDPYAYDTAGSPHARAAVAVWVSAGLLFVLSVCCAGMFGMLGAIPIGELKQMDEAGEVPPEMWDQLAEAQPHMPAVAVGLAVVTMLPAIALLILGFYVRGGRRGAMIAAQAICWVPFGLLVIYVLLSLPAVATTGVAGVVGLLPSLAVGGVLFWAIRSLRYALRSPVSAPGSPDALPPQVHRRGNSPDDDPWEHLL